MVENVMFEGNDYSNTLFSAHEKKKREMHWLNMFLYCTKLLAEVSFVQLCHLFVI